MPRLIGQQTNVGSRIVPLLILVVIAGGLLQYYGIIDVPGMGKRIEDELRSSDRPNQPVLADSSDQQFKLSLEERNA